MALGNAQIGGNLWSTNWNYAGGTGWLLDRSGNFYGNNVYARGDIEASSLKANTAMVQTLNIAGQAVSVSSFVNGTSLTISVPPGGGDIFIVANIIHSPSAAYTGLRTCYLYFDGVNVSQAYVNSVFSDLSYGTQPGSNTLSRVIFAAEGNHTISIGSTAALGSATISATILRR